MKSKNRSAVWHVFVISFVLFAGLLFFVSYASAQEIGTVKSPDGGTVTTEYDYKYSRFGLKVTTKNSEGKVIEEEWKGPRRTDGKRDTYEDRYTSYDKKHGTKTAESYFYEIYPGDRSGDVRGRKKSFSSIATDANGTIIREETLEYDPNDWVGYRITRGIRTTVDPQSGKKTVEKYNPKTAKWEAVEAEKKEEPKKEPPKKDETPKKTVPTGSFPGFSRGKYVGRLTIEHVDACHLFPLSSTDVFLTVSPEGTVMVLEYEEANTKAADYFESKDGGLVINANHMSGGGDRTVYRFDVTFTYDSAGKHYTGTGTWAIQDNCSKTYPATITLEPR